MKHRSPFLSVVLPVYNQAEYLAESVTSVFEAYSGEMELIVINDGSQDDVVSALKPFQKDSSYSSRLKLITQENQGISKALNRGFLESSGIFLTWTSADNRFRRHALDKLCEYLQAHPHIGMTYSNIGLIDENGSAFTDSEFRTENQVPMGAADLLLPKEASTLLHRTDNFIGACFLYRRVVMNAVGDYVPEKLGYEDYDYWLRVAQQFELAHIDTDEILYDYRLHRKTLTHTLDKGALWEKTHLNRLSYLHSHLHPKSVFKLSISPSHTDSAHQLKNILGTALETTLEPNTGTIHNQASGIEHVAQILSGAQEFSWLQTSHVTVLRHSTHSRYFKTEQLTSWFFLNQDIQTLLANALQTPPPQIRSFALLPPVSFPPLLRRARDGSFGAVRKQGKGPAVLVFSPEVRNRDSDQLLSLLTEVVSQMKHTTFVLYCENPEQREFANEVFRNLQKERSGSAGENLRIIDATKENDKEQNLLFTLGSIDGILHLPNLLADQVSAWNAIQELRIEAGLAAMAGKPLLYMNTDYEFGKSQDIRRSDRTSDFQSFDFSKKLYEVAKAEAFPIPHITVVNCTFDSHSSVMVSALIEDLESAFNFPLSSPYSTPYGTTHSIPNRETLEAWLHLIGPESSESRLKKFLSS